jgi:hypothetical protein
MKVKLNVEYGLAPPRNWLQRHGWQRRDVDMSTSALEVSLEYIANGENAHFRVDHTPFNFRYKGICISATTEGWKIATESKGTGFEIKNYTKFPVYIDVRKSEKRL